MKKLKWNLGIMVIRFGYFIRKYQYQPKFFNFRWMIGVQILKIGYKLRGDTPMGTWKWNYV